MLLLRATLLLQLLASSHGGGGASREPLELVWSSPTLVDAPSAANPAGPHGSPDNFVALDSRHFFGGEGSFSSDGGKTWALQQWARPDPYAMYPLLPVQGKLQTVGGPSTERTDGWDLQYPMRYAVNASSGVIDKTSVVGTVGPNKTLVTFSGIPYPGVNISNPWKIRPGGRTYGALQMANGEYLMTTCVMWNGLREEQAPPHEGLLPKFGFTPMSVVAFTSKDALTWTFASVVVNASWTKPAVHYPPYRYNPSLPPEVWPPQIFKYWGPTEHDLETLSDNRTVMAVLRMDGDSGCRSDSYEYYHTAVSTDFGRSFTRPAPIEGAGCARPRLKRLVAGPLLLTGGRVCVENTTGLYLWLNQDGMGGKPAVGGRRAVGAPVAEAGAPSAGWSRHSISAAHNELWRGDPQYLFTGAVNDSAKWETLAYTSILPTGADSAAIIYQKFLNMSAKPWPGPSATFVIHVDVKPSEVHAVPQGHDQTGAA